MTMRDRLAADLHDGCVDCIGSTCSPAAHIIDADRLIALGWVRLDEEALARVLNDEWPYEDEPDYFRAKAAAIIRALREEEGWFGPEYAAKLGECLG